MIRRLAYSNADGTITATAFPGNIIPTNRINPISDEVPASSIRQPNLVTPTLVRNDQQAQGRPINKDQFILRMDFIESSKSQWFGRYSWGDENS